MERGDMMDETVEDDSILRALMPGHHPAPGPAAPPAAPAGSLVTPSVLRAAGRTAGRAGGAARAVRGRLEHAHGGLAGKSRGFGFAAELATLCTAWADRLGALGDDCAEIDRLCSLAARTHEANDARVVDDLR